MFWFIAKKCEGNTENTLHWISLPTKSANNSTPLLHLLMTPRCSSSVAGWELCDEYVFVSIVPDTMKPSTALSLLQHSGWTHSITGFTSCLSHTHTHTNTHTHFCRDGGKSKDRKRGKHNPKASIITRVVRVSEVTMMMRRKDWNNELQICAYLKDVVRSQKE